MNSYDTFRDYVNAWIQGRAPVPPVVELVGIRLLSCDNGSGIAELAITQRHHNAMGTVHGGILCDLADVAIGSAIVSLLAPNESFVTVNLGIDFLGGIKGSLITARAQVVKRGATMVFCECQLRDDTEQHVASVRSTSLVRSK